MQNQHKVFIFNNKPTLFGCLSKDMIYMVVNQTESDKSKFSY